MQENNKTLDVNVPSGQAPPPFGESPRSSARGKLDKSDYPSSGSNDQSRPQQDDQEEIQEEREQDEADEQVPLLGDLQENNENDLENGRGSGRAGSGGSVRSDGNLAERNFGDLREEREQTETSSIYQAFVCDLLMYIILLAIYADAANRKECGIPVTQWLVVHLSLFFLNSIAKLMTVIVIRHFNSQRVYYNIFSTVLVNVLMVVWLVYGNTLYFSPQNDCFETRETKDLATLMLFFLIIGYIQMTFVFLLIFVLPCLIVYIQRSEARARGDLSADQIRTVANSLNREQFDPSVYKHEVECLICLRQYTREDNVTLLDCHSTHYFHSDCLEQWVESGKNSCPICRAPILQLN